MSLTKGTPASSQIITLERVLAEKEAEIDRLREALRPMAECHLPPEGLEHRGVTAHFLTEQIVAAKNAMALRNLGREGSI